MITGRSSVGNPDKEVRNKYGNTRHRLYLDTLKIRKMPSFSGSTKYQSHHLLFGIFYLSRLTYAKSALHSRDSVGFS